VDIVGRPLLLALSTRTLRDRHGSVLALLRAEVPFPEPLVGLGAPLATNFRSGRALTTQCSPDTSQEASLVPSSVGSARYVSVSIDVPAKQSRNFELNDSTACNLADWSFSNYSKALE
jgi:hypothetical protein